MSEENKSQPPMDDRFRHREFSASSPSSGAGGGGLNITAPMGAAYEPGGFWRRFAASSLDGMIIGIAKAIVAIPVALVLRVIFKDPAGATPGAMTLTGVAVEQVVSLALWAVAAYFYFGYFYSTRGASPGKQAMGLKVLDSKTGTHLTWMKAFWRETVGKFCSSIILLIGYIMAAFNDEKLALHDKMFDTRVVHLKK